MIDRVYDRAGGLFFINPMFDCYVDPHHLHFVGTMGYFFVPYEMGFVIADKQVKYLVARHVLVAEAKLLFSRPYLCEKIFSWKTEVEIEIIKTTLQMKRKERYLDVGCGWGRLLREFWREGYRVDGFDANRHLVNYLQKRRSNEQKSSKIWRCNADEVMTGRLYAGAYSAMNTLRYLMHRFTIVRHFTNLYKVMERGAMYVVEVSVAGEEERYCNRWTAEIGRRSFDIVWQVREVKRGRQMLIDEVAIYDENNRCVMRQFQAQARMTVEYLTGIVEQLDGGWLFCAPRDRQGTAVPLEDCGGKTVWLGFRRR